MSLLIVVSLIAVGLTFLYIERAYEHGYINEKDYVYKHIYKQHCKEEKISKLAADFLTGYLTALFVAVIGCLGAGGFWWLKYGNWLTVSPQLILNELSNRNVVKEILLKESSWVGIQEINAWYLQSNLAWSFLCVLIVLILFMIFTTK